MAQSRVVSAARLAALDILQRVEDGAFASILLARTLSELQPNDRGLTQELVLGVLRWQLFLDSLISHYARRSITSLDLPVLLALRLGLYQLRFLTRIPPSAAVNESVKLVQRARLRSAESFVNAILRRATREADYDPLTTVSDPLARLSLETSHPAWLLERWIQDFGIELASSFAVSNNSAPPLAFRVVNTMASPESIVEELKSKGAALTPSAIARSAWRFDGPAEVLMKLAMDGKVYIQDEASQLVGEVVNPQDQELLLDLCAAPGSKTTHIADLSPISRIVASDYNEVRLRTVLQTAVRHKLSTISCLVLNGLEELPFSRGIFDAVLVDAPCSGTGTLRRNPEIRWRITAADIRDLSCRQRQLLAHAAEGVKPGGRLVYSTCSVETAENEEIIQSFLALRTDFERAQITVNASLNTDAYSLRTWPQRDGADGFFVTQMKRARQ